MAVNEIGGVCVVRDTAGMREAEARGNRGERERRSATQRSAPASTLVAHQKKPETPTSTRGHGKGLLSLKPVN